VSATVRWKPSRRTSTVTRSAARPNCRDARDARTATRALGHEGLACRIYRERASEHGLRALRRCATTDEDARCSRQDPRLRGDGGIEPRTMRNSSRPRLEKTRTCLRRSSRECLPCCILGHRVPKASTLPGQHHFVGHRSSAAAQHCRVTHGSGSAASAVGRNDARIPRKRAPHSSLR
jgi:hypothetical protein